MEISASYWEPKIKIYGFQETVDLSLIELTVKPEQIERWGLCMVALDEGGARFRLTLVQPDDHNRLQVRIVSHHKWEEIIAECIENKMKPDVEGSLRIQSPVELIYFQGPHFGDRYGIADSAFNILEDNNITVLASGCSGSVVYILFPEKNIKKAKQLLMSAFEVPKEIEHFDMDNSSPK